MSFPTRKAVLGLIARRPTYGYAILRQLRRWSPHPEAIRTSSVYTALSRLEADQLIESREPADASNATGPSRVFYRVTETGQIDLDLWLGSTPQSYEELRLRIALARPQDLPLLIRSMSATERACLTQLRDREGLTVPGAASRTLPWEALCGTLLGTLDVGELAGRAKWLQDARVALESLRDHTP
jgi:DNA-binding PadR family transcriptional regulator